MKTAQLQQYLKNILALEIQYQTDSRAAHNCELSLEELSTIYEPVAPCEPKRPEKYRWEFGTVLKIILIPIAVYGVLCMWASSYDGGFLFYVIATIIDTFQLAGWIILGVGAVAVLVLYISSTVKAKFEIDGEYESQLAEYKREKEQYEQDCVQYKKELNNRRRLLPVVRGNQTELENRASETKEILEKYYDMN